MKSLLVPFLLTPVLLLLLVASSSVAQKYDFGCLNVTPALRHDECKHKTCVDVSEFGTNVESYSIEEEDYDVCRLDGNNNFCYDDDEFQRNQKCATKWLWDVDECFLEPFDSKPVKTYSCYLAGSPGP